MEVSTRRAVFVTGPSVKHSCCYGAGSRKTVSFRRVSQGLSPRFKSRRVLRLCAIAEASFGKVPLKQLRRNATSTRSVGYPEDTLHLQNAKAASRTVTVTIHGLESDEELRKLEANLRTLNILNLWLGPVTEGGPRGGYVIAQLEVEGGVPLSFLTSEIQALDTKLLVLPFKTNSWMWRGHNINFAVAGCGRPLILVHGFGGNAAHFSRLISYLADSYKVYAVDLLGFGASDKPKGEDYSPDLWGELLADFMQEFTDDGAVLVGNSIGSLTAVTTAAKYGKDLVRGLVLLNCAGGMNRKGLTEDGWILQALSPVFAGIEWLLQRPRLASFLFNRFRNKDNIKKILTEQAYRNKEAVTDQLVDVLYHPSTDEGALEVFVKVFTSDNPGSRPEKLMSEVDVPVLVLWGDSDPWTPVSGSVAKYFIRLATERTNVQVYALKDVGHCPHDDRPEVAAQYIVDFLSSSADWTRTTRTGRRDPIH